MPDTITFALSLALSLAFVGCEPSHESTTPSRETTVTKKQTPSDEEEQDREPGGMEAATRVGATTRYTTREDIVSGALLDIIERSGEGMREEKLVRYLEGHEWVKTYRVRATRIDYTLHHDDPGTSYQVSIP